MEIEGWRLMQPRRFVIADIHGCCQTFRKLALERIGLERDDELYLLGDLIDRGPDSKGVLDFIFDLRRQGFRVESVLGNHEEMLLLCTESLGGMALWMVNGGLATLHSFGSGGAAAIPGRYLDFLRSLPEQILLDDFVIVHAGLNFTLSDPFADRQAKLWMRDCVVDSGRIGGRRLINGHTPVTRPLLEDSLKSDRILLDNGCVFSGEPGLGSLAALELNSMEVCYQENIDC